LIFEKRNEPAYIGDVAWLLMRSRAKVRALAPMACEVLYDLGIHTA
jgi:hypothetical protein